MKYSHLLLTLFIILSIGTYGQQVNPALTKQLDGASDSTAIVKIEKVYDHELKKHPKDELLLKLWKLSLYDSLGFQTLEDSFAIELLPNAEKIHHAYASRICLTAGNIQIDKNEFEQGISIFYRGLKIAHTYKDYKGVCVLQKAIGIAYLNLDDYKTAEKHLREGLSMAIKIENDLQIANISISLGNALKEQKDFKNAVKYYNKSLQIALKLNNQRLIAGNYNNLGNVMRQLKNNRKALEYFQKALEINIKSKNRLWESFNYHNIGNVYTDLKNYNLAINFFKKSNQIKVELGDSLSLISGYEQMSRAYSEQGDYKNAYVYLKNFVKLKDTLNIIEQANLLKDLEVKYESEKKQSEIEHLKMSSELQNVKNDSLIMQNQKNRNISILSVLAAISLLIGVGILWKTNKRRQEVNKMLNAKNDEIEDANQSLHQALNELSIKNKEVIDSINYATYIQQAALPSISQLSTDLLHFELFFVPKDIVSGDFYFSYQLYKKSVFGVADCTGHGVPGAMVSLVGMNSLDKVVREESHPTSSAMVESLNDHVKESLQRGGESINDGMDISFCYINHEDNILHFTGANHTAFILRKTLDFGLEEENDFISTRTSNEEYSLIQLQGVRRPIGESISKEPFIDVNFNIKSDDRIILFSDGFADQVGGEAKKKLKKGVLLSMLLESSKLSVKEQIKFMKEGFEKWKGDHEQVDDVCLLIVNVN